MAAISDKITKTMSIRNPATTTVAAQRAVGATELRGVNLDGWQDETATHFITYKIDTQGDLVEGSQTDWKGVVNRQSNSIVNLKRTGGAADQGNAIGDVIESAPTAAYGNELAEALLRHHDTEGRLKPKTVTYDHIDETTEYKYITSPNDLNDPRFFVSGKWRFGSNSDLVNAKNMPVKEAGWLDVMNYYGDTRKPGQHQRAYVLQIFTTLTGRTFSRPISSGAQAGHIHYGKWQEFAKVFNYIKGGAVPTGDVWVNGKPVMRLTVDIGSLVHGSSGKNIKVDIPDGAAIVKLYGVASNGSDVIALPHVHEIKDWSVKLQYHVSNKTIHTYCAQNRSDYRGHVFIDYVEA